MIYTHFINFMLITKTKVESLKMNQIKILLLIVLLLFIPFETYSQVVTPLYDYGSKYIENAENWLNFGILKKAEEDVNKSINQFPNNPSNDKAILIKAQIYLSSKSYKLADATLSVFINNRPNSPFIAPAALLRSFMALEQREYAKADQLLEFSYDISNKEFQIRGDSLYRELAHISLYWRAISLAHQGKYQDAQPLFLECVKKYPDGKFTDDAIYALGQISEINRKYEEAIEYYTQIQKNYQFKNSYLSSLIREANNRLILRQPQAAIAALEKAKISLEHIDAKDSIGKLYEFQTNSENINEEIHYLSGEANILLGNFKNAELILKSFLETYQNSKLINSVRFSLAWALLNLGNYQQAIDLYDKVINDQTDNPDELRIKDISKLYKSIAYKLSGNIEQAKIELSNISVQPDYQFLGAALLELGQIYYEEGNYEQAKKYLERAERESTYGITDVRIRILLGATYLELKEWNKAINEYEAALKLATHSDEVFLPGKTKYIAEARLKQAIAYIMTHRSLDAINLLIAFTAETPKHQRIDEAVFWLAEAYYRADMLNLAAATFENFIEQFRYSPRREEALYSLGWTYLRMKEFGKSAKTFDQLITEFPNTEFAAEALSRQGDGHFYTKNYRAAANAYDRAKRLAPNTEHGQYSAYQLCHALYRLGDYERSISALMDFVRRYPKSPYAPNSIYLIGWIRFQQKRYNEAIDNFRFLISSYPQSDLVPRTHYAIGDAYFNQGEYEKAISSYKVVIESYPGSDIAPEAMRSIQYSLMALGREDEVIKDIDSYITTNPTSPFALDFQFKKAELVYTGRKYKDAITEYETIIQRFPDSERAAEALYWMIKSYLNLNDEENANKTYQRLISKYPKSDYTALSLLELGLYAKKINAIFRAESLFSQLVQKYPNHQSAAQASFEMALIRLAVGDTISAMQKFREVSENYPNTGYASQSMWKIAMYYRFKGDFENARQEFARIIVNTSDIMLAAEAQYSIGELWMREKQYDKAIEAFTIVREKYVGVEDWYSLALLNLGECYEQINDFSKAREVYQILESTRPDDDFGKTSKRRLKRLPK